MRLHVQQWFVFVCFFAWWRICSRSKQLRGIRAGRRSGSSLRDGEPRQTSRQTSQELLSRETGVNICNVSSRWWDLAHHVVCPLKPIRFKTQPSWFTRTILQTSGRVLSRPIQRINAFISHNNFGSVSKRNCFPTANEVTHFVNFSLRVKI